MIAEELAEVLDIAKDQTCDGAQVLDLCVDHVGNNLVDIILSNNGYEVVNGRNQTTD